MYFYIFDPPVGAKEYERTAQIKELLGSLGIAGEMTQPQPGKSVADLVHTAITKRYSTIIAVGGIDLINQIARAVEPHDIVFGIIPTVNHPDITELIGTSEWRPAAEQLKRRRWQSVRMSVINKNTYFLTPAIIELSAATSYIVATADYQLESSGTSGGTIHITPRQEEESGEAYLQVDITLLDRRQSSTFFSNFLRRKQDVQRNSRITASELEIECEPVADVSIAGTKLAVTPVHCSINKRPIRLIVNKGTQTA